MKTLLGIDFGTGGCKVTAIDFSGKTVGEASIEYATFHEHPGWSEQDPADWYAAFCKALRKLAEKGVVLSDIEAAALDGSTHNAVLLDGQMKPVRRTIMWTDQRSTEESARLKSECGDEIFRTCFQMPAPTWTLPQMMWLNAHEPEVLKKTAHVLFVKDYVRYLLTGNAATDRIEAQGTLFFDMAAGTWSDRLVTRSGLRRSALPEFLEPSEIAGAVTIQAAAETGLRKGMPIICGSSDSAVEDYGAGAIACGDLILKLATAGNVNAMTDKPHPHPATLTYSHIVQGLWYSVSATNAAALCLRWFRDTFLRGDVREGSNVYTRMDEEASTSPAGARGVFFHPYLQGERSPYWDANLRASFTGVSIGTSRADFIRALLEGVAFSLKDCYGTIHSMGLDADRIFLIGGGARSSLWGEIVANVFNRSVAVPSPGDASFGSALLAGVGIGVYPDVKSAVRQCLHVDRIIDPNPGESDVYENLFTSYQRIHDALAPVYSTRKHS